MQGAKASRSLAATDVAIPVVILTPVSERVSSGCMEPAAATVYLGRVVVLDDCFCKIKCHRIQA